MGQQRFLKKMSETGLDEVARGSMFGRMYTAAVTIDDSFKIPPDIIIRDSKLMTENQREKAYQFIVENAKDWAITWTSPEKISQINVSAAGARCFHKSLDMLKKFGKKIIVDGNYFPKYLKKRRGTRELKIKTECKADRKYISVSCASILAKHAHTQYIKKLVKKYPKLDTYYGIGSNKGYCTEKHRQGVEKYGVSKYHRMNYKHCIDKVIDLTITKKIKI